MSKRKFITGFGVFIGELAFLGLLVWLGLRCIQ